MRFLFSILLSLFFISSIAAEQQSSPADAAPVRIGCTISVPPFVILENDRGITLDILRQAFRNVGREVEMSYAPNADNISAFSSDRLDGLCVTNERESSLALFSKYPLVSFHNTVISLQKNNININQVTDLESYSTLAFNMAKTLLSEEFFNVSQKMPEYNKLLDHYLFNQSRLEYLLILNRQQKERL